MRACSAGRAECVHGVCKRRARTRLADAGGYRDGEGGGQSGRKGGPAPVASGVRRPAESCLGGGTR
eukprot:scaffold127167_cov27-Tisochrysis_lutea.AAC.1